MIFVTVGTNEAAFDRLIRAVAALDLDEELVVQRGSSNVSLENAEVHEFLPFEVLVEFVRSSRIVVSHAGVGSIMVALANGRKPIVVPRLKDFGEAVDDHQDAFAGHFEAAGLVRVAEPETLSVLLGGTGDTHAIPAVTEGPLAADLRRFISEIAGVRPAEGVGT